MAKELKIGQRVQVKRNLDREGRLYVGYIELFDCEGRTGTVRHPADHEGDVRVAMDCGSVWYFHRKDLKLLEDRDTRFMVLDSDGDFVGLYDSKREAKIEATRSHYLPCTVFRIRPKTVAKIA